MSWECGGRYYTRSRRRNGSIVRSYVGGGQRGLRAARADRRRRESAVAARRAEAERRTGAAALDLLVMELGGEVDVVVRAAALCGGFHVHRGELRRRAGSS